MPENTSDRSSTGEFSPEERSEPTGRVPSEQATNGHDSRELDLAAYRAVMDAVAEGDYTARLDPDEVDDDLAELAPVFNRMIEQIESQMQEVWAFTGDVNSIGSSVASGAVEIEAASERVSQNIRDISERTREQRDSIAEISSEMDNFSATMQEIASSATEVAQTAKEATERGEEGR